MALDIKEKSRGSRRGLGNAAYELIAESLRDEIRRDGLATGSLMPSLRQLTVEFNVSMGTIQQAVALLVTDGVLIAKPHRGLYVADKTAVGKRHLPTVSHWEASLSSPIAMSTQEKRSRGVQRELHIGIVSTLWEETFPANKMGFGIEVVRALESTLSESSASTEFSNTGRMCAVTPERVAACTERLINDHVDAIAVVMIDDMACIQAAQRAAAPSETPLVLITSNRRRVSADHVFYDNCDAGAQAARHLIKQGCRNLVFFSPISAEWVTERLEGIRDAMNIADLPQDNLRVYVAPRDAVSLNGGATLTHHHAAEMYAEQVVDFDSVDGVIADNDDAALGFIKAAAAKELSTGRDYLIVGFDDNAAAREYGLTSLRPPAQGLAEAAATLLLAARENRGANTAIGLHSHPVRRNSTRRHQTASISPKEIRQ